MEFNFLWLFWENVCCGSGLLEAVSKAPTDSSERTQLPRKFFSHQVLEEEIVWREWLQNTNLKEVCAFIASLLLEHHRFQEAENWQQCKLDSIKERYFMSIMC